jgi:trehalose synthase
MTDVGLHTEWHVIYGREEFFNATKLMHNALQGAPQEPPPTTGRCGSATTR